MMDRPALQSGSRSLLASHSICTAQAFILALFISTFSEGPRKQEKGTLKNTDQLTKSLFHLVGEMAEIAISKDIVKLYGIFLFFFVYICHEFVQIIMF